MTGGEVVVNGSQTRWRAAVVGSLVAGDRRRARTSTVSRGNERRPTMTRTTDRSSRTVGREAPSRAGRGGSSSARRAATGGARASSGPGGRRRQRATRGTETRGARRTADVRRGPLSQRRATAPSSLETCGSGRRFRGRTSSDCGGEGYDVHGVRAGTRSWRTAGGGGPWRAGVRGLMTHPDVGPSPNRC